jgi:hypothetical protein
MKQKITELIVDESSIELSVTYYYEKLSSQMEEGHGFHDVGGGHHVEISHVELIIDNQAIQILPLLSQRQLHSIIDQLSIYE